VIKWMHPSNAPTDGSTFALITSKGELESCAFGEDDPGAFTIATIATHEKRTAARLDGYVGWATWPHIFAHIQNTSDKIDKNEINDARHEALLSKIWLEELAGKSRDNENKEDALNAIKTIDRILKLLP
jgi:hypothetical protein